jgi:AraC-like DNA-binding protein
MLQLAYFMFQPLHTYNKKKFMITLDLSLSTHKEWLKKGTEDLVKMFYSGRQDYMDDYFMMPEGAGKGIIKHWEVEKGLSVICIDCQSQFQISCSMAAKKQITYGLFFCSSEQTLIQHSGDADEKTERSSALSVFFTDSESSCRLNMMPHVPQKMTAILFDTAFYNNPDNKYFHDILQKMELDSFYNINAEELVLLKTIKGLSIAPEHPEFNILNIKGNVYRLLGNFLGRVQEEGTNGQRRLPPDAEKIVQLDREISQQLNHIPSLREAAVSVGMSRSKFKTLFKELFHAPYFHYYKKKQMFKARDMMIASPEINIKQVASAFGITNAIVFTRAFKQVHSMLPRDFKQQLSFGRK